MTIAFVTCQVEGLWPIKTLVEALCAKRCFACDCGSHMRMLEK